MLLMILLVVLPDENGHWHGSGGSGGGGGGARERPLGHKYHAEMKHRVTPVTHIALSGDILTAPPPVSSTNFIYYVPVYPVVSLDPRVYTSLIIVILLSYLVLSRPPPRLCPRVIWSYEYGYESKEYTPSLLPLSRSRTLSLFTSFSLTLPLSLVSVG